MKYSTPTLKNKFMNKKYIIKLKYPKTLKHI